MSKDRGDLTTGIGIVGHVSLPVLPAIWKAWAVAGKGNVGDWVMLSSGKMGPGMSTWSGSTLLFMAAALAPKKMEGSRAGFQSGSLLVLCSWDWSHQILRAPVRAWRACKPTQY